MASFISVTACCVFFVLHAVSIKASDDHGYHWGYGPTVPVNGRQEHWGEHEYQCGMRQQSPIDIGITVESEELVMSDLGDEQWIFLDYENEPVEYFDMTFGNSGHNVDVTPSDDENVYMYLFGGGLAAPYVLIGFHFHWGSVNTQGSEHQINGKQYAAELHFVHRNWYYDTTEEAKQHSDGLAVVAVLIEVGENDNDAFEPFISALPNVPYTDSPRVALPWMMLTDLMPKDKNSFYRYQGSLTTPPCSQAVIWTVFSEAVHLSQAQIDAFRTGLYYTTQEDADPNKTLINNFRLPQPLNGRPVYVSDMSLVVPEKKRNPKFEHARLLRKMAAGISKLQTPDA